MKAVRELKSVLSALVAVSVLNGCNAPDNSSRVKDSTNGVCYRSYEIQDAIVLKTHKSCHDISASDLAQIASLSIEAGVLNAFTANDLEGLTALREIAVNVWEISPDFFEALSFLETIDLVVEKPIPSGIFQGLRPLRTLRTTGDFDHLDSDVFTDLGSLRKLEMRMPDTTSLPDGLFSRLSSLEELHVTARKLKEVPNHLLQGASTLKELFLTTGVETFSVEFLAATPQLKSLGLYRGFKTLPVGIFDGLANLEQLDMTGGTIETLETGIFRGLHQLKELSLWSCKIKSLPSFIFQDLTSLNVLVLSNNQMAQVDENVFSAEAFPNNASVRAWDNEFSDETRSMLEQQLGSRIQF